MQQEQTPASSSADTPAGAPVSTSSKENTATPPCPKKMPTELSVDSTLHWYVIRATRARAQKVNDTLSAMHDAGELPSDTEIYLPMRVTSVYDNSALSNPEVKVIRKPLYRSLLFIRCRQSTFQDLIKLTIPGFSPWYNHVVTNQYGKNPYLIVPDRQFYSFRTIVESQEADIIVDQQEVPTLLKGDRVRVTDGPFAGVEGTVLRYKHQLRVFVQIECLGTFGTAYVSRKFLEKL